MLRLHQDALLGCVAHVNQLHRRGNAHRGVFPHRTRSTGHSFTYICRLLFIDWLCNGAFFHYDFAVLSGQQFDPRR